MCKSHANTILPTAIYGLPPTRLAALRSLIPAAAFQCAQSRAPTHPILSNFGPYNAYGAPSFKQIINKISMMSLSEEITLKKFADAAVEVIPGFPAASLYLSPAVQDLVRITNWLGNYVKSVVGGPIEELPIYDSNGIQVWAAAGGNHVLCEIMVRYDLTNTWEEAVIAGYALAAAAPREITEIILMFPLQGFAHTLHVGEWVQRDHFLDVLMACLEDTEKTPTHEDADILLPTNGAELMDRYGIGRHLPKEGTLAQSLRVVPDGSRTWQYFLSSPRMTKVTVKADDMAASRRYIQCTGARIFIHSPYIINLCQPPGPDNYGVRCLRETLAGASAAGCLGVVVHVGKSVKMDAAEALANMRENVLACLDVATVDCPLLLETPAGQGTETLLTYDKFFEFVAGIADPRLRVCLDTCHVFASGQCPLEYLQRAIREYPGWVRLIHFNDSLGASGSCVDRHAPPGSGHIGLAKMTALAEVGRAAGIGMLYE